MATLHVITGPMFAGKTEELQRLLRRAQVGQARVAAFIPRSDTRSNGRLLSHAGIALQADAVSTSEEMLCSMDLDDPVTRPTLVAIDEVQFFDFELPSALWSLVTKYDVPVIAAGLNRDFRGTPFPNTEALLSMADTFQSRTAVCVACGEDAAFSHRLAPSQERLLPGGKDAYEARCRRCWSQVVLAPWVPE